MSRLWSGITIGFVCSRRRLIGGRSKQRKAPRTTSREITHQVIDTILLNISTDAGQKMQYHRILAPTEIICNKFYQIKTINKLNITDKKEKTRNQ